MSIRPTHVDVELSQTRPELAEQELIGPKTSHDVYGLSHALVRDMIQARRPRTVIVLPRFCAIDICSKAAVYAAPIEGMKNSATFFLQQ